MILQGQEVVDWFVAREHSGAPPTWVKYHALGKTNAEGDLVAAVLFDCYNSVNFNIHIHAEGTRWPSKSFLAAIFHYPFRVAGVRRLTAPTVAANLPIERLLPHLGFELEATLQGAHPSGDLHIWRMFRENCRWIDPEFLRRAALERLAYG